VLDLDRDDFDAWIGAAETLEKRIAEAMKET
jgi:hypothetical protein